MNQMTSRSWLDDDRSSRSPPQMWHRIYLCDLGLQVFRVSDLEIVSVLPSAEDEVNVACFHPLAGGGFLSMVLSFFAEANTLEVEDRAHCNGYAGSSFFAEANTLELVDELILLCKLMCGSIYTERNVLEVQTYALEC